ncbi:MAG: hypothetical protein K9L24_00410 [Spirochaetia bacterium]|nr:hypothetical protein [Spirochaetia bacterium]MCF7946587.1 hypothetical protein [Spirochaetia bacterium]
MTVEQLKKGETLVGTMLRLSKNSAIALTAKHAGMDFIMPDMEHSTYSFETLAGIARVAKLAGVECFVRVSELSKSYVSGALDAGVTGVMVPMIETPEQAKKLAFWGKYMPVGGRGFGGIGDHTGFVGAKALEFMPEANRKTLTIAQIETATAIDNIEEIASVEGIDALLVGPNDLANSLGIPGDVFNEKNVAAIKKVARVAKTSGKVFGFHGPDKLAEILIPEGLKLIMSNHDAGMLLGAMKQITNKYKGK